MSGAVKADPILASAKLRILLALIKPFSTVIIIPVGMVIGIVVGFLTPVFSYKAYVVASKLTSGVLAFNLIVAPATAVVSLLLLRAHLKRMKEIRAMLDAWENEFGAGSFVHFAVLQAVLAQKNAETTPGETKH